MNLDLISLDLSTRGKAIAALSQPARKLYNDMALGGRLCCQLELRRPDGVRISAARFWTEPDGKGRPAKAARELIASGALMPFEDGLFDSTAQTFVRDPRL